MLQLHLLHSNFKASFLLHTLKTLTKLLIKLNRFYAFYYVPKIFRIFFHHLPKRSVTFVTVEVFSCKTKFSYLQNFSSCLRRLSNHVTYVTIICVTKFKPEFQKNKARKCSTFYQRKRDFSSCKRIQT